jgi:hypothetical protein
MYLDGSPLHIYPCTRPTGPDSGPMKTLPRTSLPTFLRQTEPLSKAAGWIIQLSELWSPVLAVSSKFLRSSSLLRVSSPSLLRAAVTFSKLVSLILAPLLLGSDRWTGFTGVQLSGRSSEIQSEIRGRGVQVRPIRSLIVPGLSASRREFEQSKTSTVDSLQRNNHKLRVK